MEERVSGLLRVLGQTQAAELRSIMHASILSQFLHDLSCGQSASTRIVHDLCKGVRLSLAPPLPEHPQEA